MAYIPDRGDAIWLDFNPQTGHEQAVRWQALMTSLGIEASLGTYQQLVRAYAELHRHYHTVHHISACLQHFDCVRELSQASAEVEIALWFHDAVYQPRSSHNEQDSADWAKRFLQEAGLTDTLCWRVHHLIMATKDHTDITTMDTALVVDIDLSILGQDTDTFANFETNIRREYHWVPVSEYCRRRSEILASFLQHPHVYQTSYFQERYEAAARTNLQNAISTLQNGILPEDSDNT